MYTVFTDRKDNPLGRVDPPQNNILPNNVICTLQNSTLDPPLATMTRMSMDHLCQIRNLTVHSATSAA